MRGKNASPAQRGPRREIRLSVAYFLREHSFFFLKPGGTPPYIYVPSFITNNTAERTYGTTIEDTYGLTATLAAPSNADHYSNPRCNLSR